VGNLFDLKQPLWRIKETNSGLIFTSRNATAAWVFSNPNHRSLNAPLIKLKQRNRAKVDNDAQ